MPPGWRLAAFGECAVLVRDSVSPTNLGDMPYVGLEHVGEGTLSLASSGVATEVTSTKSRFTSNDVLFGKLRPYLRKVARARFDGICSTDIWVVRPAEGVDAGYLFHVMASQKFVDAATRGSEGTKMPRAKWDLVSRIRLSLPPLKEQRYITAILDCIDDALEHTGEVIAAIEQLKDSLLHELLTRGVPGWHTEWKEVRGLGTVPASWDVVQLGDVADVVMGQSPPGKTVSGWSGGNCGGGGLPFIQGNAEFGAKYPSPVKWCSQPLKVARCGDILISLRAPVGETSRVDRTLGIGRGLAAIHFTGVAEAFGWHALNQAKRAFDRIAQGSTFEAIGSNELRSLPILLPPLAEYRAIAATLDSIDVSLERAREERAALQSLKESTVDALLTGSLRIALNGWSMLDVS